MSSAPWVCLSCRSVNQPRENRCYRCRTPRDLAEADPETLIVAGAGSLEGRTAKPVGVFRSSGDRAFLTQVLVVAAISVTVVSSVLGADVVGRVLEGDASAAEVSGTTLALVGGLGLALGVAALVSWAFWLSRVVANVPAVGLGFPNVTPNGAILESLVPGANLYFVPAILRDVTSRLEPGGRGDALIAAAWLGLVGGVLLPRASAWVVLFVASSPDELAGLRVLAGQIALGLTVAGGILLVALIWWIENAIERRAAAAGPTGPASGPDAPTGR